MNKTQYMICGYKDQRNFTYAVRNVQFSLDSHIVFECYFNFSGGWPRKWLKMSEDINNPDIKHLILVEIKSSVVSQ